MDISQFGRAANNLVLDTSSSNLKFAVGSYNSKTGIIQLEKFGVVPLELETITDGAISDNFGVVMALKHAMAKHDIKNRNVIVTTEGAFMHSRDLELPAVTETQLKDMVKYEILGQGSANRDMLVEYIITGKFHDEESNSEKYRVRATAIPKDVAMDYKDFIKNMDMSPVALDVNPNAIRKLFSNGMINGTVNVSNSTLLLIELAGKTTTITVLDKGYPILSRRLQFGHANISQVAETLKKMQGGADKTSSLARRLNISKSDAESAVDLADIDLWHEALSETPTLQSAANAYFKSLTDAVSRTAQFSISKFHVDSISTCFLYGSGASYRKIDKELSRQLGTQVEVLNTLSTVIGPKNFELPQFINCCGALIRED
ncbi:MAG: pilus assembly protein PilM [Clostridia bacterium]|nr:pilus assembly protein PilM [Clostridia bacterium]